MLRDAPSHAGATLMLMGALCASSAPASAHPPGVLAIPTLTQAPSRAVSPPKHPEKLRPTSRKGRSEAAAGEPRSAGGTEEPTDPSPAHPRGSHPPLRRVEERGAPALYEMTLPNGLNAVIDARPGRRTVYCEIGVRVGSRHETLELAGMSHLLEHLLFKEGEAPGARKNPAFSRIRAAGGIVNASTFFERTNYYCDVHADAFEEGWRGLADLVTATAFDARDVEVERRVVLEEAALDKNNPLSIAAFSVLGRLFPGDPLGQPVIGFRKTLSRIRFEDVDGYYRRYYVPANSYALVVGDVDVEAAASLITVTLGGWSPARRGSVDESSRAVTDPGSDPGTVTSAGMEEFPPPPRPSDEMRFVFRTFTHQVYYGTGVITTGETDRYRTALDLLNRVLSGGMSSRLHRRIVESEGLTSLVDSENYRLSNLGVFAAGGAVDPGRSTRFRAILREEMHRLSSEPVGDDEIELARTLLLADTLRAFESNTGIAAFRADRLLYGQPISRDEYLDEVRRLTPQDLFVAARVVLAPEHLREVEIRPARGFGKILAALRFLIFRRM